MALEQDILGKNLADSLEQEKKEAAIIAAQKEQDKKDKEKVLAKKVIVLKNTLGDEVDQKDYFYSIKGKNAAPHYFNEVCGYPVDREDMLGVFHKVFKPKDGFLFYKTRDKEVYVIIVPIKHSSIVGLEHDSIEGDFQKHAISFITEGSVNLDTLQMKLKKVRNTIVIAE